ncbi:MAG: hypothetical protein J6Q48_05840 [Bacteroidaceae bacterium]|nr:hypothetical protein [Bacteroidaceae bacterium]
MKKTLLFASLLALFTMGAFAQEKEKPSFKFYGFVRNYACYDTRESLTSNSEQFYYMPKDIKLDANGEDLNAQDNIMLLSITTRLGLNVSGLEFLGSKTSAKIEADFAGFGTSNTVLRIRQAYAKMDWEHSKVLVGQAWHPAMGDMMPDVFSLETGAPFTPFSRTPQIRYDYETKNVKLTATALYQFQYTSYGPNGASFDYARNAIVPEMYFQGTIKSGDFMMGLGVDVLTLKPRTQYNVTEKTIVNTPVVDANGNPVLDITTEEPMYVQSTKETTKAYKSNDQLMISVTPTLFASYKKGNWGVKGRVTYAQNAAHMSMISGYAVTEKLENGDWKYSSINSIGGWVDATYKLNLKKGYFTFCCFAGYTKNLGCMNEIKGDIYMRGEKNMDYMWRVAPSILYTHNAMQIGVEYNPTTVGYGKPDSKYNMSDVHAVTNHRICAILKYNF